MYVEKIHIDTFGKLSDVDLELKPGVNIIQGENESGKSTVAEFIRFMLYGVSAKERDSLMSWKTGGAAGSMTVVTDGGKRIRVERAVIGTREAVQLIDCEANMPMRGVLDGTTPGEYFFGVDADMFYATAFVSQLGGSRTSGGKVAEGIENILFSADESVNTKRALTKLDTARAAILHKNDKGGRLFEINGEIARIELRREEALRIHKEVLEKEARLEEAVIKLRNASQKADTLAAKVVQFENRMKLELFDKKREIEAHVAELKKQLEAEGAADLAELRAMEAMDAKIAALQIEQDEVSMREAIEYVDDEVDPELEEYLELGGREGIEAERDSCRSKAKVYSVVAIISAALSLGAFGFGLFPMITGGKPEMIPVIGGAALMLLALMMLVLGLSARKRAKDIGDMYDIAALDAAAAMRKKAVDSARFASLAAEEARRRYNEACETVRATYGCESYELVDKIEALNEKLRDFDGAKSEYDKNIALLEHISGQLAPYSEAELKAAVDDSVDVSDMDIAVLPTVRRDAETSAKLAAALEKLIADLEKSLAGLYPIAEDPVKLDDKLKELKSERVSLESKRAAYALAFEKLNEASESLRNSIAPQLAREAAAQMAFITDGKYSELGVGADLVMNALTEHGSKPVEQLSAGTQDAAYLSLRLALVALLYRKERPAMIFDEAFVRQDDTRLAAFMKLIAKGGGQSIVLTATDREASAMKNIGDFGTVTM